MIVLRDSARDCYVILSRMVENKEACDWRHPLVRAMNQLQKRYGGVFPQRLNGLWKLVRLPTEPNAAISYHDGVPRLKLWFEDNFNFEEEEKVNASDEPRTSNTHSADEWFHGDNRNDPLAEGMGASEESST